MAAEFPSGKRFAFTILDDTDVATVENVAPVYRLLEDLGMFATKTVWPVGCPEGSRNFSLSQTLDDPEYLAFVLDLERRGFEITWHGATMESSTRERTVLALERFHELFRAYPRVHANHAMNLENIYWGSDRIDDPVLKLLFRRFGADGQVFFGHVPGSPHWWGDLCERHIEYVRNLTFSQLDLSFINPSMPYHDPARPCVRLWFSAADANDAGEFVHLLRSEQQESLERNGGFSIVATHFGKDFARDSQVLPQVRKQLEMLARRPGWFPTVSGLLDWLHARRSSDGLPRREWRRMQWLWARDLAARKLRRKPRAAFY